MTNARPMNSQPQSRGRWLIWTAGLIVALGAAVATAHGMYEVAIAATVPPPIAWLYPLITDGLALVAYASTTRLAAGGRRYAWLVVILAAGLSGLAQASYLAIGVHTAPTELRFGVGAWPAIAAAITAHLLYLLASVRPEPVQPAEVGRPAGVAVGQLNGAVQRPADPARVGQLGAVLPDATVRRDVWVSGRVVQPTAAEQLFDVEQLSASEPSASAGVPDSTRPRGDGDLSRPAATIRRLGSPAADAPDSSDRADPHTADVQPESVRAVHPGAGRPGVGRPDAVHPVQSGDAAQPAAVQPVRLDRPQDPAVQPLGQRHEPVGQATAPLGSDAPIDRARTAALAHHARHGDLPSVSQLADAADVARGTAATALKRLREQPPGPAPGLHIVHPDDPTGTNR